jgi:hypothetical protein
LLQGPGKLVGTTGPLATAIDATQQFDHFAYRAIFNQGADTLGIAGATAGELHPGHDLTVELDIDEAGAGILGLVSDIHNSLLKNGKDGRQRKDTTIHYILQYEYLNIMPAHLS